MCQRFLVRNSPLPIAVFGLAMAIGICSIVYGAESEWRVGLAKVRITPNTPIPMCGYSPQLSAGVLDELYAKAMAIEHTNGQRALLLTADLLFFRAPMAELVCTRIMEKTGLQRQQILLNASHTHAGPLFGVADPDRFDLPADQRQTVDLYTQNLLGQLVDIAVAALAGLQPARLSWGVGAAGDFVMNRRLMTAEGTCRGMGPNPQGPVDRDVPVLRVDSLNGQLRAILFGTACHPVTLDGSNRKISGDYASFAQQTIENKHPGVQAMFMIGCGGDANTHPRGGAEQEELARGHGDRLGIEVCRVAAGPLQPIHGPLKVELQLVGLPLEHTLTRAQLQTIVDNKPSYWHEHNAREMLDALNRNQRLPHQYHSPVALWQFGDDLTLVGLPGEAVAEYAIMLREVLGPKQLWIAAYCNESFGYLPTAKMLSEGGHETMCLTLAVGFFAPTVQAVVIDTVRHLARKAGRMMPP